LRYWNDGRDVPDTQIGVIDYAKSEHHPQFQFVLRVNFKSSKPDEDFGYRFIGSEGSITTDVFSHVTVDRTPREKEPGNTADTFSRKIEEQILREYAQKYPKQPLTAASLGGPSQQRFSVVKDAHQIHMRNFIEAVRTRKPFFEDAEFGFRATAPALLCNTSYFEKRVCHWDAATLTAS
jgi:hypothetical protein